MAEKTVNLKGEVGLIPSPVSFEKAEKIVPIKSELYKVNIQVNDHGMLSLRYRKGKIFKKFLFLKIVPTPSPNYVSSTPSRDLFSVIDFVCYLLHPVHHFSVQLLLRGEMSHC